MRVSTCTRLLSVQLGLSFERYLSDRVAGMADRFTGGWGTLLHPTLVWGPGHRLLVFGSTSFPLAQSYRDRTLRDRWRVGTGLIWLFSR